MIRKMKKLSLFVFHEDKEKTLHALSSLGVVHIEIAQGVTSENIDAIASKRSDTLKAKSIIKSLLEECRKNKIDVSNIKEENSSKNVYDVIENVLSINQKTDKLKSEKEIDRKDITIIEPFGDFSFEKINKLKNITGYTVEFYSSFLKEYKEFDFSSCKDITPYEVKEEGNKVYFITLKKSGSEETIPFDSIIMPNRSLSEIKENISNIDKEIAKNDNDIIKCQVYMEKIEEALKTLDISVHFEEAKESFIKSEPTEGHILFVEAYLPIDKENVTKVFLNDNKIAYILEDPSKDDKVPVELKNNKYSASYELITKLFQLPNYFELDLTPMIAIFYPIFFAFCFGDSGYGIILTVAAIIGLCTVLKGKMLGIGIMAFTLGICTIIMGIINGGSIFGVSILEHRDIPIFNWLSQFIIITDTKKGWFLTPFNTALLCGVLQIFFALILSVIDRIRTGAIGDILGAIGKLMLIPGLVLWFLGDMQKISIIRTYFNPIYYVLIIAGAFFLVVLSNVGKKPDILNSILSVYFAATGIMGDTLSYIRLFALGASGSILALVVNQIGLTFKDIPVVGVVIMVVFLVVGHTANFALNILGALVHPLRLTFVEFYNNVGFIGGGKVYKPLRKTEV